MVRAPHEPAVAFMASRSPRAFLSTIGLFALLLSSLPCSAASNPAPTLRFQACSGRTEAALTQTLRALPRSLRTLRTIIVRCVAVPIAYGFQVELDQDEARLTLGPLAALDEERARYRADHLSPDERESLWHRRGLVHALALHGTRHAQWHLLTSFRAANGWDELGGVARNQDSWGYSRRLGQRSALHDFVTFAEEWFVRPSRRPTLPDNRVECQSFTKGRAFTRLFAPDQPDLPPRSCASFWAWSDRYPVLELTFSQPTSSPVSSFGHLGLLLRASQDGEPEYEDAAFQYVGLLESAPGPQLHQVVASEVPLILQGQPFIEFDRQVRYAEDRRLSRLSFRLSPAQLVWVKARLWEQIRRFRISYRFATENCAEQILALLRAVDPAPQAQAALRQPGPTTSPLGAIALLQRRGVLSREVQTRPSLTEALRMAEQRRDEALQPLLPTLTSPPPALPATLGPEQLQAWTRWLDATPGSSAALRVYLHRVQDHVDLLGWRSDQAQDTPIPVRVPELLALQHRLFHVEQTAEEQARRVLRWSEEHATGEGRDPHQARIADALVARLSERLEQLPDADLIARAPSPGQVTTAPQARVPAWGADGALTIMVGAWRHDPDAPSGPAIAISGALYDERQGLIRSVLREPTRDLQVMELALDQRLPSRGFARAPGRLALTPLRLATRGEPITLRRPGVLVDVRTALTWSDLTDRPSIDAELESSLGASWQLARWMQAQGDLSLGVLGSTRATLRQGLGASLQAFGWLTLPLGPSWILGLKSSYELANTDHLRGRWSAQLHTAWRFDLGENTSVALLLALERPLRVGATLPRFPTLGVRLQ